MNWAKFLTLTTIVLMNMFQNSNAMEQKVDEETPKNPIVRSTPQIKLHEDKVDKPLGVTLQSENLFMRNVRDEADLDYYFQIFFNPVAMEKYMNGISRPSQEIIGRHKKYLSWAQDGNPYTSYLVFLNQEAATKFLEEEESKLAAYSSQLNLLKSEAFPLKGNLLREPEIILKRIRQEFKNSQRIFIGHVLLEPGDDRGLDTDAEVSYVFLPAFWNRGLGTEAVKNITELAKVLYHKEIPLNSNIINTIIATALPRNPGSCKVLEKNGFTIFKTEEKFGESRHLYTLEI